MHPWKIFVASTSTVGIVVWVLVESPTPWQALVLESQRHCLFLFAKFTPFYVFDGRYIVQYFKTFQLFGGKAGCLLSICSDE